MFSRIRFWIRNEIHKLTQLRDQPDAISWGFAVGVFIGFTPLLGIKTLLSLLIAWLMRANRMAAVIGVTLHDVLIPIAPVLLRLEFQIGYWILHHELPPPLHMHSFDLHRWMKWKAFVTTGVPVLIGSIILAIPLAIGSFWLLHFLLQRHEQKRLRMQELEAD